METKTFVSVKCYPNYFLICFKTGSRIRYFDLKPTTHGTDLIELHKTEINKILLGDLTIGFNSISYDLLLIRLFLRGATNADLHRISEQIITSTKAAKKICKDNKLDIPSYWDHVDLIEVVHVRERTATDPNIDAKIKLYGARMHTKILQDVYIDDNPGIDIDAKVRSIALNNVNIISELYERIKDRIDLRAIIGKHYNMDLCSKSDAQVAEAIIKKMLNIRFNNNKTEGETAYKYTPPSFIDFKTDNLKSLYSALINAEYRCNATGDITKEGCDIPSSVKINNTEFSVGIGGLHSKEKHVAIIPKEGEFLLDVDVISYYPNIILNNKYYPSHLGGRFLKLYQKFYDERIKAKDNNDKIKSDTFKIILNGSFGKFGSKYSILYSPSLLLHTTLTGQLSLLMLIEKLMLEGFDVVSANTDGVTIKGSKKQFSYLGELLSEWERVSSFTLEKTFYKAAYYESVNSYIALFEDGKVKRKGIYGDEGLSKNPVASICVEAVIEYLRHGTSVESTIESNKHDITKFLVVRQANKGAVCNGDYLGKVVRWYYGNKDSVILCKATGNKVAGSDGAVPLMILPASPVKDINISIYVDKSRKMLKNIGVSI